MLVHNIQTFLPDRCTALHAAELSIEEGIEAVEMMLRPANAGAAHCAGEALLIGSDGILDKIEVDVGDLEDVERQVAFEYTGAAEC